MEWIISIEGNDNYLEELTKFFEYLNDYQDYKIFKENNKYYLKGNIFNEIDNVMLIKEIANSILTFLVMLIKPNNEIETINVIEFKKIISNDEYEIFDNNGELKVRKEGNNIKYIGKTELKIQSLSINKLINKKGEVIQYEGFIENINNEFRNLIENDKLEEYTQLKNYFINKKLDFIKDISVLIKDLDVKGIIKEINLINTDIKILIKWFKLYKIYEIIILNIILYLKKLRDKEKITELELNEFIENQIHIEAKSLKLFRDNANFYYRHPTLIKNELLEFFGEKKIKRKAKKNYAIGQSRDIDTEINDKLVKF